MPIKGYVYQSRAMSIKGYVTNQGICLPIKGYVTNQGICQSRDMSLIKGYAYQSRAMPPIKGYAYQSRAMPSKDNAYQSRDMPIKGYANLGPCLPESQTVSIPKYRVCIICLYITTLVFNVAPSHTHNIILYWTEDSLLFHLHYTH